MLNQWYFEDWLFLVSYETTKLIFTLEIVILCTLTSISSSDSRYWFNVPLPHADWSDKLLIDFRSRDLSHWLLIDLISDWSITCSPFSIGGIKFEFEWKSILIRELNSSNWRFKFEFSTFKRFFSSNKLIRSPKNWIFSGIRDQRTGPQSPRESSTYEDLFVLYSDFRPWACLVFVLAVKSNLHFEFRAVSTK